MTKQVQYYWLSYAAGLSFAVTNTTIYGDLTAVTSTGYDGQGRAASRTDARGNTVFTQYDSLGQALSLSGATYPVQYAYDSDSRQTELNTTRDGLTWDKTRFLYDGATGLLTNKVYADNSRVSYSYTQSGRPLRTAWARGVWKEDGYDTIGQLESVSYSDATPDVYHAYDVFGRTIASSNSVARYEYANSLSGIATNETATANGDTVTLVRRLDGRHRMASLSVGNAPIHYGYDVEDRLAAVSNGVFAVSHAYTPDGWDAGYTVTLTTGMILSRAVSRDPYRRQLVTAVTSTIDGVPAIPLAYGYDILNRVTGRNADSFGYNARSEVTSAIIAPSHTNRYEFDTIGNNLWTSVNAATNLYSANELNQYTRIANGAAIEPEYDLDGNMTRDGRFNYAWDGENRLVAVYSNSMLVVSNAYDHQSRRVLKVTPAAAHTFVYDGWNLIAEVLNPVSGVPATNRYVWGTDLSGTMQGAGGVGGLLAVQMSGTWFFPFYDNNGNVIAYVDEQGAVAAEYTYDAFGRTIAQSWPLADAFPHRFSTKYCDAESELYYYGYRFYAPELMRWLSRDPIEEDGGANLYAFVANNPNDNVDLLGLIDLRRIPSIMRANGWSEAGTLLDRWFGNPTVGPVQPDTTTIRMEWVLGFARARTVYNSIFFGAIYRNDAAKREIMRLLMRTGARAGDSFGNLNRSILDVDNDYVNSRVVGSTADPLDGLLAALGRFQFRITVEGNVCAIRPTSALVQLHRVGVYVIDSFDFQGEQHLGYWNDRTNYGGRNPFRGDAVRNRDFRAYSAANGVGQDFMVYSNVMITDLPLPPETIFVRQ